MLGERKECRMIQNIVTNCCRVGKRNDNKSGRHWRKIPFMLMREMMPIEWPELEEWPETHRRCRMPRSERRESSSEVFLIQFLTFNPL